MREIKFRAWTGHLFIYFSLAELLDPSKYIPITMSDEPDQYTGLKDKNGKEIYEGDIVKECTVGSVIWDGEGVIEECPTGIVEIGSYCTNLQRLKVGRVKVKEGTKIYSIYGTGYSPLNLTTYDGLYQWPEDIEVIGNIYENPELLKEED